eukprot:1187086-Prorocentrum_minimum.AAC.3
MCRAGVGDGCHAQGAGCGGGGGGPRGPPNGRRAGLPRRCRACQPPLATGAHTPVDRCFPSQRRVFYPRKEEKGGARFASNVPSSWVLAKARHRLHVLPVKRQ